MPSTAVRDMMVNPPRFNIINEDNDFVKFSFTITNSLGNTFDITDCYFKTTYDDTESIFSPTVDTYLTDCDSGGKCGTINVLLQGCTNNETMIVSMVHSLANTLVVDDVISAAGLARELNLVGLIVPSQGVDTCYTVGGQTSSLTSQQPSVSTGTNWSSSAYKYAEVIDCNDSYCGCKSGFTVNNIGGTVSLINVEECDGTLIDLEFPPSSSTVISDCINMNSFWGVAGLSGSSNLSISPGGSYNDCT